MKEVNAECHTLPPLVEPLSGQQLRLRLVQLRLVRRVLLLQPSAAGQIHQRFMSARGNSINGKRDRQLSQIFVIIITDYSEELSQVKGHLAK